tara:strand:+ start:208 stop:1344 length:1137 start_codon:yes stop_codon:yes gene_type:complete
MANKKNAPKENLPGDTVSVLGTPTSTKVQPVIPDSVSNKPLDKKNPLTDMFKGAGKITVKPFTHAFKENMGLEEYGFVVFPGIYHEEQLAAIERNGVVRYITGLDEFAPEVQNLSIPEKREAVIYNIRTIVAHLEKMLATNVIKITDEDFWNKVKLLRPDNHEFWSKITLRVSNEPVHLNPTEDPYDLIKYIAIEAGGFDLIGKSFDDSMAQAVSPKFYLDKAVHTISSRTSYKKLRNKAIGILDSMSNKNTTKLLYVTKAIDANSVTYKNHTPTDVLYDVMDEYINGEGVESNKSKAAQNFIDISKLDMETLKLKSLVKDAAFYKVIALKVDGMLYHSQTSTMLGRNVSDVVEYLKNPLNEDMLLKLLAEIEGYWNN